MREKSGNQSGVSSLLPLSWNRKSVGTTFKLSKETSELLTSLIQGEWKSVMDVFDNFCFALLLEETPPPPELELDIKPVLLPILRDEKQKMELEKIKREVRKTYVISQTALAILKRSAMKYKISRDALVEFAVQFSKKVHDRLVEYVHINHTNAFDKIKQLRIELERTSRQLNNSLGPNDPISNRFGIVCIVMDNLVSDIERELTDGTPIDPYDFS